jgi:glutathione synthase/RimK-type ligase-like ATP-grasp enzyme
VRFVVVGDPEGKRTGFFQAALSASGLPAAEVLSWPDFLAEPTRLEELVASVDEPLGLRIESVGKSFPAQRALLERGADADLGAAPVISASAARSLAEDRGRIRGLRQAHEGFRWALGRISALLEARPALRVMNPPPAIALMFDKPACHAACAAAGVSVPPSLGGVSSYEDLRTKMSLAKFKRVFVKPAHASSASGVIGLATDGRERVAAYSSVELVEEGGEVRLYNSRKIRRYTDERQVATIVDALAPERLHVEAWIPKAKLPNSEGEALACDLRCVVIGGKAQHSVVRTSQSPLTNLHLLNPRGELSAFQEWLGESRYQELLACCEAATRAMGPTLYAGVDVCVAKGLREYAVLEVNAFGDLLPRVEVEGRDTYAAEIAAFLEAA